MYRSKFAIQFQFLPPEHHLPNAPPFTTIPSQISITPFLPKLPQILTSFSFSSPTLTTHSQLSTQPIRILPSSCGRASANGHVGFTLTFPYLVRYPWHLYSVGRGIERQINRDAGLYCLLMLVKAGVVRVYHYSTFGIVRVRFRWVLMLYFWIRDTNGFRATCWNERNEGGKSLGDSHEIYLMVGDSSVGMWTMRGVSMKFFLSRLAKIYQVALFRGERSLPRVPTLALNRMVDDCQFWLELSKTSSFTVCCVHLHIFWMTLSDNAATCQL